MEATKPPTKDPAVIAAADRAEERATKTKPKIEQGEVGPDSAGEIARLEREVDDLKGTNHALEVAAAHLNTLLRVWGEASEWARQGLLAVIKAQPETPPADDGLTIPDNLRREPAP